jgi:hypothetical protein
MNELQASVSEIMVCVRGYARIANRPLLESTMTKSALIVLPLIVCACSAPAPRGDIAGPATRVEYAQEPGPYTFDCDAQAEQSRQMNIRSPGGELQVTGSFRILTNRAVSFTYPFVTIGLISPANHSAVQLGAVVTNSDITRFSYGTGTPLDMEFAKEAFTTTTEIPFVLKIDHTGKVTGSIDDIKVPGGRSAYGLEYIRLTCSTARVRFSNVTLVTMK